MKIVYEVVNVFDIEPFQAGDGEVFRFRLEVFRQLDSVIFKGRVYRLETYRLQPTFPQSEGEVTEPKNDALIYVLDHMINTDSLSGNSVEKILENFQKILSEIFCY
jgi:hypothetical protein